MDRQQRQDTRTSYGFITNDRMLTNILISTAIGLIIIAVAVGLAGDNTVTVSALLIATVFNFVGIFLVWRGYSLPGRVLFPLLLTFVSGFIAYNRGGLYHVSMLGFPIIVVISGLLLETRGLFIFATIGSIVSGFIGYADINGLSPFSSSSRTGYDDIAVVTTLLFITAFVLRVIIQRLTESVHEAEEFGKEQEIANIELRNLQEELEQRISDRTKDLVKRSSQLETIASLARSVAGIQDINSLLPAITKAVSEDFGVYHAGVFLVDTAREFAVLRAASSEGGQKMLSREHKLKVGEQGIVGNVALSGNPRIALDVGDDAVFFNNPDLPETHSEVALPLKFGQEIIGVLDVQSTEINAFSKDDMEIFTVLADQLSVAIQNARSLEQAKRAVNEAEFATSQLTGTTWKSYADKVQTKGYRYDGLRPEPIKSAATTKEKNAVQVPVELRGQTIGRLKLMSQDASRKLTEDELAIIQSTADRVALAIDSARLLDEAQKRAARETILSEISSKLSSSSQLDNILRDTVEELGSTLKGSTVTFQLVNPQNVIKEKMDDEGSQSE